ncbi:thiol-disulfide oxidoreductase DCC family protein [Frankia sp. R82]|uniref:thiol-disulfide oxidoreductase DCC family protein n=1 Tax=Frankia sp. R82 TaxID=2950553 RepID=UPI0035ABE5A3
MRSSGGLRSPGRDRPLFLYDGDCGFCTRSARFLRSEVRPAVDIEPWQRMPLAELGVSEREAGRAVQWIGVDGRRASGAAAIALILRRSRRAGRAGSAWRIAGWIMSFPPLCWLAAGVYRLVATHRHRLPGATDGCAVAPVAPGGHG